MSADRCVLTDREISALWGEAAAADASGATTKQHWFARRIEVLLLERVAAEHAHIYYPGEEGCRGCGMHWQDALRVATDEKARGGMGGGGEPTPEVRPLGNIRHPSDPAQTERCNHLSYYDNDGPCGICDGRASADPAQDLPPRVHTHNGNACYLPCAEQPSGPPNVERLRERAHALCQQHDGSIGCRAQHEVINALADAAGRYYVAKT